MENELHALSGINARQRLNLCGIRLYFNCAEPLESPKRMNVRLDSLQIEFCAGARRNLRLHCILGKMAQSYKGNFIDDGSRSLDKRRSRVTIRRASFVSASRRRSVPDKQHSANACYNKPTHDHPSLHQEDDLTDERHLPGVVQGEEIFRGMWFRR